MDGFASKVRYSLAFLGGGVLAANACAAATIGDDSSVTNNAGQFYVPATV
jgi:hypothetical protein